MTGVYKVDLHLRQCTGAKDRNRRPVVVNESLKFFFEILSRCSKVTSNTSGFPKLEYLSQLVTRLPRDSSEW
jgi:hypothetical protein